MSGIIDRLKVRLANAIARAVVQLVDDSKKLQLLQLGVLQGETIDEAEHVEPYGFTSIPLAGAEAVVVFPNGDRGHALVIACPDRRHRPTGGQPGEVTIYNNAGVIVKLTAGGKVEIGEAGLLAADGVVTGLGIDSFTGATYAALGNVSAVVRAKK